MGDTNLLSVSRGWRWATEESHLSEIRAPHLRRTRATPRLKMSAQRSLAARARGHGGGLALRGYTARECFVQNSLTVASLIEIGFLPIPSPIRNNRGDPDLTHPAKDDHSETARLANCLNSRYNTRSGRFHVDGPAATQCLGRWVLTHPT